MVEVAAQRFGGRWVIGAGTNRRDPQRLIPIGMKNHDLDQQLAIAFLPAIYGHRIPQSSFAEAADPLTDAHGERVPNQAETIAAR